MIDSVKSNMIPSFKKEKKKKKGEEWVAGWR